MKPFNRLIITTLLCLLTLSACGSNSSDEQRDSNHTEQTPTPIKEEIQQCPLELMRIEEALFFEAILRDGKALLRFPKSLREKILNFYPLKEIPMPPFRYATNDEYQIEGLTDECDKIVFINIGQQWDNPMLYFIQKDGAVKVLSFLRAIWYDDFTAVQHPASLNNVVDVVSRDEEVSDYRSAFAISRDGKEIELGIAYTTIVLSEEEKNSDDSPQSTLVATQDFRIFFIEKSKNGLWQELLVGTFISYPDSREAEDVLDYHFTHRKTYRSEAPPTYTAIDMRGTMLGEWEQYNESAKYIVTSRDNTAPFVGKRIYIDQY